MIAGDIRAGGRPTAGPIGGLSTEPLYFDVRLPAGAAVTSPTPAGHNAFLYVYEGDAAVGDDARPLPFRAAGLLTPGDAVRIAAGERARGCCSRRQADRRTGGAVRAVRDEHGRRRSSRRSRTTSAGRLAVCGLAGRTGATG